MEDASSYICFNIFIYSNQIFYLIFLPLKLKFKIEKEIICLELTKNIIVLSKKENPIYIIIITSKEKPFMKMENLYTIS